MAKLSNTTISSVFELQRRLIDTLDSVTDAEFKLFEQYGETVATNDMLDLLYRSVEVTEHGLAAGIANLNEIKRNWSDL
jgi:hypothetical protein